MVKEANNKSLSLLIKELQQRVASYGHQVSMTTIHFKASRWPLKCHLYGNQYKLDSNLSLHLRLKDQYLQKPAGPQASPRLMIYSGNSETETLQSLILQVFKGTRQERLSQHCKN
ncbi:hypothetical protein XENORESO_006680 [Xenotaenia resolanae]|uniref:Transposase n=1 Tax=Xenotaenia resolanae TaxID=208358 RepID=A0ABV0WKA8_9TELE